MRDRQRQLDRPKIERLSVADKTRRLRSFTQIGGFPIVHGALMRDRQRQLERPKIERLSVADKVRGYVHLLRLVVAQSFTVR